VWDNPAERAHRIVVPPTEIRPPTPAELSRLLDHVQQRVPVFHVLVVSAAMTGARRAQLLGLRWSDVHLNVMRVSFCRGWVNGEQAGVVAPTKTKRRHSVEISANTHRALMAVGGDDVSGFVFSDDQGSDGLGAEWVTKTFIRYRRAAGVGEFQLRDLRHFMATEMLHAGIPLPVVARRLDHQRPSTTLNSHAHAVPGGDADAALTLEALLAGAQR
jgi:integrase